MEKPCLRGRSSTRIIVDDRSWTRRGTRISRPFTIDIRLDSTRLESRVEESAGGKVGHGSWPALVKTHANRRFPYSAACVYAFSPPRRVVSPLSYARDQIRCAKKKPTSTSVFSFTAPSRTRSRRPMNTYNYAQSRDRLPILRLSVKKEEKIRKVFPCANLKMIDDFSPWNRVLTTARFSREEEGYSLLLYYSVPFYYSFEVGWIRRSPMGDVLKSFKVFWNYQERYRPSF